MTRRKQNKKRGSGMQKNIALELAKARNLNQQLIKQLMVVANSPDSEPSKAIIEHYRNVLTQMKNDNTINPDSNSAEQTAAVPNPESTSGNADSKQLSDGIGGDYTVTK